MVVLLQNIRQNVAQGGTDPAFCRAMGGYIDTLNRLEREFRAAIADLEPMSCAHEVDPKVTELMAIMKGWQEEIKTRLSEKDNAKRLSHYAGKMMRDISTIFKQDNKSSGMPEKLRALLVNINKMCSETIPNFDPAVRARRGDDAICRHMQSVSEQIGRALREQ